MNPIKLQNLLYKQKSTIVGSTKGLYTNHEIILDFLNRNSHEWFFDWEIPNALPLGWVGNQKRRRIQELAQEGKILVEKVGKYSVYSSK